MTINRELAIQILRFLYYNQNFYFPFLVVCKEYSPEDDDFVEIEPEEWESIEKDKTYQTFELWENLNDLKKDTIKLLAKGFIEKIIGDSIKKTVKELFREYDDLYNPKLRYSESIEKFGENEYIGGKKEAFEDLLKLLNKYNF